MDILIVFVGLFMIGIGFLVKSFPNLIAGYNTMPKEKKQNVNIEGLSAMMRDGFIAIGVLIIIGYFFFKWMGLIMIANSMILIVILIGTTIILIKAQKFDHNKSNKSYAAYLTMGFVFVFVIGLLGYGYIPAKVTYKQESIHFSGMYGFEIAINDIANVELVNSIPLIKIRTNGFSFAAVQKGYFNLQDFDKSRLLMHSESGPYLILTDKNGLKTLINFKSPEETETTYTNIKNRLNSH